MELTSLSYGPILVGFNNLGLKMKIHLNDTDLGYLGGGRGEVEYLLQVYHISSNRMQYYDQNDTPHKYKEFVEYFKEIESKIDVEALEVMRKLSCQENLHFEGKELKRLLENLFCIK